MSGDEVVVLLISVIFSFFFWGQWLLTCLSVRDFDRAENLRLFGIAAPVLASVGLFVILQCYASHDVRDDLVYLAFYVAMGAGWLALVKSMSGLCGLSFRDDWVERGNPAAAIAGTGALFGGMLAFAGGNIGDGPGWWVVVFCALLATASLFLAWWIYARLSGAMELVSIERDTGAGWRVATLLLVAGIISGRSVAGNWESAASTIDDFTRQAWPLLPYAIGAGLIEAGQTRGRRIPEPAYSLGTACVHAGVIVLYLYWAGPWN